MKEKFIALLTFTSSLRNFGTKFIRVAILVVFVWIGGLKYFHYEADGIVPFVASTKTSRIRKVLWYPKTVHGTKRTTHILSPTDWERLS